MNKMIFVHYMKDTSGFLHKKVKVPEKDYQKPYLK